MTCMDSCSDEMSRQANFSRGQGIFPHFSEDIMLEHCFSVCISSILVSLAMTEKSKRLLICQTDLYVISFREEMNFFPSGIF